MCFAVLMRTGLYSLIKIVSHIFLILIREKTHKPHTHTHTLKHPDSSNDAVVTAVCRQKYPKLQAVNPAEGNTSAFPSASAAELRAVQVVAVLCRSGVSVPHQMIRLFTSGKFKAFMSPQSLSLYGCKAGKEHRIWGFPMPL